MSDNPYHVHFLTDELDPNINRKISDKLKMHSLGSVVTNTQEKIKIRYDDDEPFRIHFNRGEDWDWNEPRILMTFWTLPIKTNHTDDGLSRDRSKVQSRIEKIIKIVADVVEIADPEYVYSAQYHGAGSYRGVRPLNRPIADNVSKMNWLAVFSESVIDDLGGRKRVLNTPAWRVEELDSGHIMVIKTDNPVDPKDGPSTSTDEYLFGG